MTANVTYADLAGWAGRTFWLQFDSVSMAHQSSASVTLVGDGAVKTVTLSLSAVRFANRENSSSDLRIVAPPGTRLHIDRVAILKSTTTRRATNPCP